MGRVRIKDRQSSTGDQRRHLLWKLMFDNSIAVNKVHGSGNGYVVLANDDDVEKMLVTELKAKFSQNEFEIIDPPELNAKRTMVITGADSHISSFECQQIASEIERVNKGIKIVKVIKLPTTTSVLKIQMETSAMVRKLVSSGLLLFGQSFPPRNLSQDIFINLPQCMKCYDYSHVKKDCTKSDDYAVCSSCADEGHRYDKCSNVFTKCLTCSGDHPTMAARCPNRKSLIQKKTKDIRDQSRTRAQNSYAKAASSGQTAPTSINPPNNVFNAWQASPQKHNTVISTAIIFANMKESVVKGSFQKTFDAIMTKNGLPTVLIPTEILCPTEMNQLFQTQVGGTPPPVDNTSGSQNVDSDMDIDETRKRMHDQVESGTDSDTDSHSQSRPKQAQKQTEGAEGCSSALPDKQAVKPKLKKVGLSLYAPNNVPLPKQPSQNKLVDMLMTTQVLKYQYTGSLGDEEVKKLIVDNSINLTTITIQLIKPDRFRTLTNGHFQLQQPRNQK